MHLCDMWFCLARHRRVRLECALINLLKTRVSQFLGTTSHLPPCRVHRTLDVSQSVGSIDMIKFQPTITQMMLDEVVY